MKCLMITQDSTIRIIKDEGSQAQVVYRKEIDNPKKDLVEAYKVLLDLEKRGK